MKNRNVKKYILSALFFLFIGFAVNVSFVQADEDKISAAKEGIVEIYSGYVNDAREFKKVEHASGFLIYNRDDTAFVLTTYDTLHSKKYEGEAVIKVVVNGDVTIEASIVTYSKNENYAVLQLESGIAERSILSLGNSGSLTIGDTVYALGFPEETDKDTDFIAEDVEIRSGVIQDTTANQNSVSYLQHSAQITKGSTGGPLLDEKGYVVGLNNVRLNEDNEVVYYSLPVDSIRNILNNFELRYSNEDDEQLWNHFLTLAEECKQLVQDGKYSKKTRLALNQVLEQVLPYTEEDPVTVDFSKIKELTGALESAKGALQEKTRLTVKIMYVLAAVIVLLAFNLLKLVLGEKKATKKSGVKKPEKKKPEKKKIEEIEEDAFERTMILSQDVLNQNLGNSRKPAAMIRVRDYQNIEVNADRFYIGKQPAENDYVVEDNKAISRKHACIIWSEGNYYIEDLGSANGTWVNEEQIPVKSKVKLANNDRFILADEAFIFRV